MLTAQRKHENTDVTIVSNTWFRFARTMPFATDSSYGLGPLREPTNPTKSVKPR